MRILVTGSQGTVGAPLAKELKKRGHEVWGCDLLHTDSDNYMRVDVSKYRQLEKYFEKKFDCVYHLAAEFGRWNGEDYYENLWLTNLIGTKNIIRLQEKMGFKLVFFSSSEVYGDYEGVMKEDVMDKYEIKQLNDYALTKWASEQQIINSSKMFGTKSVRVRLFNTYGPGEYYHPYRSAICVFIYKAIKRIPYTVYLNHLRSSTYVDDLVPTLSNIADNFKPNEVYNIGGTDYHDMKKASDIILKCLKMDDKLVTYKEAEPFTTKIKKVDISKAQKELGHNPVIALEDGICRTVEWMKSVYSK